MNWKNIKTEIPSKEVLAVNENKDFILGYCYFRQRDGKYYCENNNEILQNITYWISLDELLDTIPKNI